MSANPFRQFKVEPAYGAFQAVVSIQLNPGQTGDVFVYRSMNGETGWKLLNPDAPLTFNDNNEQTFADQDVSGEFNVLPYYRGVLDPEGGGPSTWVAGPVIAAFSHLSKFHRTRILKILRREHRYMSGAKTSGSIVIHYIPLEDGETVSRYDEETRQLLGPSCPNNPDDEGYGTPFKGGFYPPLQTWARIIQAGPITDQGGPDSTRYDQTADVALRLLAHPRPRPGHMFVLAGSDRRYIVGNAIQPFYFPGTNVPIAWEVQCTLLPTKDPRQDVVVPSTLSDPAAR